MAKDDYFVIAYRILDYLYQCFKRGVQPDMSFISPEGMQINRGYWLNMMESLYTEGYIIGVEFPTAVGQYKGMRVIDIRITQSGIEFLEDNSTMAKVKEFLKTVKDFAPFIPGF